MKPSSLTCKFQNTYLIFIISLDMGDGFKSKGNKVKSAYEWLWYIPFTKEHIYLDDISVGAPANVLFQGKYGEE